MITSLDTSSQFQSESQILNTVVDALMPIFTKHSYVQKIIITDKGSAFTAQLLNSLMETAGKKWNTRLSSTQRLSVWSHQWLEQVLKINVAADSPQWQNYVNMAVMAHNTTHHQTLRCSPTEIFHGRIPFNALDIKFGNPLHQTRAITGVKNIPNNMNEKIQQTHTNILEAFHKYKTYYDRKAQSSPLKGRDYTFLLNQKLNTQLHKVPFKESMWEGTYKVVRVLTNSNHIIRKNGTLRTQCVHRMRLRPFTPNKLVSYIFDDPAHYLEDPEATNEQELFGSNIHARINEHFTEAIPEHQDIEDLEPDHGAI